MAPLWHGLVAIVFWVMHFARIAIIWEFAFLLLFLAIFSSIGAFPLLFLFAFFILRSLHFLIWLGHFVVILAEICFWWPTSSFEFLGIFLLIFKFLIFVRLLWRRFWFAFADGLFLFLAFCTLGFLFLAHLAYLILLFFIINFFALLKILSLFVTERLLVLLLTGRALAAFGFPILHSFALRNTHIRLKHVNQITKLHFRFIFLLLLIILEIVRHIGEKPPIAGQVVVVLPIIIRVECLVLHGLLVAHVGHLRWFIVRWQGLGYSGALQLIIGNGVWPLQPRAAHWIFNLLIHVLWKILLRTFVFHL